MKQIKKRGCILLAMVFLMTSFPSGMAFAANDTEQPQAAPQEPAAAANVEQIIWTEETIRSAVVLDDGNIHVIDSMTSIAEGGSLEVRNGALLIAKNSKLLGDVRVTGSGALINNGVIDGTLYGSAEANAPFAVVQALGLEGSVNIISESGAHIDALVLDGMTRTLNMGTIRSVEIKEGLLSPFDNASSGVIEQFTSKAKMEVVNNMGLVEEVIAKGSFWNGDYGHVITAYIENAGRYMNHDGSSTDVAYVNGGELSNHQGYPGNLNEEYPEYAIATIDTVVLNAPMEETGVWNGGYIRTLTGYSGKVKNFGCIDYLFLSQGTEYSFSSSEEQYAESMQYREEHPDDSVPFENVFPSLMDRNGIYWELSNCRAEFIGECIVDTLRSDSVRIEGNGMQLNNLCLFGRASASLHLNKPLDMLLFSANAGHATVKGQDAAIHKAGIFSNNTLLNECSVETLYIAEENTARADRYVHGTQPQTVVGLQMLRQKTESPKNGSKPSAAKVNGFAEECYKSSADELWYVTECERFAALSFRFTASTMGMATIYTPEGQVVSAISAGEETSIGCIAEEAGVYYIRVSGGEGTYTLALEKKEPIRVSYNIHRELLDGSLLSIPEYKEEYQVTLQNSTTGQPITGSVYTGEEILVVPDQANAGDTLQAQIKHLNGKTADATAQCQVTASNTAAFDARVLPKGRYMVLCENTQDACAYLFREDGSYQETLERLDEGFTSSSLDAGSYTVVLIQGGQGLYKFPTLAQYGKSGLTAGTDYLLKEIRIQDGSDTQDSIELIPDAPKATHPALNGEACAYKVSAAEAVSGAMVAAKLEYAFQDTAGVIGNIQARIQLGAGTVYVEKSAAANGVAVNAVLEGDTLVIPLSETSGTVCFYVTPNDGEASMVSAARLAFTVNGEKNDALIGSASVKITNLSLHAPQYAASDKVLLWGNGNAGEEISILDNGIEAGKALCDKAGFWSQTVTLQKDAKAGIHSLYATSNGVNSVASTLRIADAAPSVVNFTLYYMYHDSMQKMEIPGEILGTAPVRFDYMPGTDLTFSLHMTQNEKIDRLFVNAEMDGEVRTLEAFYDASAARWDATGRFGDEMSFVPGTFTISYTKKKAEEGEAADTAETETSADSGEAEPIFTDASVALLSSEEYEDRIGWEAQLMITLTGKATANIPAEYSDELVYLQNARKYLEDNGFQSAGENENGQEMYIRCWATEDSAETEIATLLPAVTSVGTAKQYFTLLSAALENGGYDPELDAYGITEAAFDELLQNRDTVLADVDYAQNVVKELENCRREGSLDSFRESFPELFEEADTTTTVSARRMRYTSGTVTLARRQPAVISPMANGSALAARIDCAVKLTRISYKVGTVVVQAAIEAMTTTVKQAETYAEWRGAQNTMEQAAETMYQISVSDHPEYYQQVYKEAEQQYIRAQDRYDQKKKELQTRCTEEIVLAGLGRVAKTTGKVTEQLLGAVAEKAVQKGVETKLGKVAIKFGDDIAKFAQEKTKDKKLGKYLEAYAKELSGKKIVGNTAELVKSLANDKIVDAIKNGLGKMVGIDRDEKPLPEEEPPLEELPIPTPVPKDEEPFDPFEQPDDVEEEPPFDPFEQPDDVEEEPPFDPFEQPDDVGEEPPFDPFEQPDDVEEEPPFDPFEQPDDVVEEPPFDPFEQPIDDGPVVIAVTPAKPQIDPSGYVYEAVRSNRVEGVMTTVYYKGADGTPVFWDAEEYGQENPLFTNRIGYYEWFVPSGEWQVVYEMEGYETYVTDWLPVPPPQTEVNVGIVSKEPPTARAYFHKNSVELIFSRYMRVEDVLNAAFTLNDDTGAQRTLTLYANNAEAAADRSGNMLASRFTATVSGGALQIGKSYSLAIPAGINSYAGVGTLPQNVEGSCTKGVKDIQAEDVLMLEAGGIVQIPIRVAAEGIPTGVVLNCTSSQRGIAQVLSVSPVSITGYCVVTVQTSRVGVIPLEITAENSCVKKTVSVQVVADESAVKDTGVSFLKVGNHPVDWVLIAGIAILAVLLGAVIVIVLSVRKRKRSIQ